MKMSCICLIQIKYMFCSVLYNFSNTSSLLLIADFQVIVMTEAYFVLRKRNKYTRNFNSLLKFTQVLSFHSFEIFTADKI